MTRYIADWRNRASVIFSLFINTCVLLKALSFEKSKFWPVQFFGQFNISIKSSDVALHKVSSHLMVISTGLGGSGSRGKSFDRIKRQLKVVENWN